MRKIFIIYLAFAFIPSLTFSAGSMDLDEYLEGMSVKTYYVR